VGAIRSRFHDAIQKALRYLWETVMRLNRAMKELLGHFRIDPERPPPLAAKLRRLLEPGILSLDGCWLLASQLPAGTSGTRDQFPDRTGYEAFVNHIHITDALGEAGECSPWLALGQAMALGLELEALVAAHGSFQIVVAADMDLPADCNVRFYKLRSGEIWIEDDLEGYAHEGILVIQTPELHRSPEHVH
jgi:hypothetical protein